jgi:apolipoprotein D and lipocalin family protein
VDNACRNADGGTEQAIGTARVTGPSTLEVRFAPDWLAFLPFVWANYWVVDLDPDYTLAAVSEPGRRYLWVLSRTPSIAPERWQALIARLQAMGLDTTALERTPQSATPLR